MASFSSFLTGILLISSSLLLGSFFNHWLIDYSAIWTHPSVVSESSVRAALVYYSTLFPGPTWYTTYLAALAGLAIASTGIKVLLNVVSGMLFDGASFMLLLSAFAMYLTNVQAALKFLPLGADIPQTAPVDVRVREALQSLAASNMIIAVSLTGVLALQAAQGYSNKPRKYHPVRSDPPSVAPSPVPASPSPLTRKHVGKNAAKAK